MPIILDLDKLPPFEYDLPRREYTCPICFKCHKQQTRYISHIGTHAPVIACICGLSVKGSYYNFKRHQDTPLHHRRMEIISTSNIPLPDARQDPDKGQRRGFRYPCPHCPYVADGKAAYQNHKAVHEEKYECQCG